MQHIPKQPHYVRCPAFELLCDNLCDPRTKQFVDPCPRNMLSLIHGADVYACCSFC